MKKTASGLSPLIRMDRNAPKPLYLQVYDAFRAAIVSRGLRAGERIPSTRALSLELGISRIPVLNAYAQLLAEGYFMTRVGAGTFVSSSFPCLQAPPEEDRTGSARKRLMPRPVARCALQLPRYERPPWVGGGRFQRQSSGDRGISVSRVVEDSLAVWEKSTVERIAIWRSDGPAGVARSDWWLSESGAFGTMRMAADYDCQWLAAGLTIIICCHSHRTERAALR